MFLAKKFSVLGHNTPILLALTWKSKPAPLPLDMPTIKESVKFTPSLL